MTPLCSLILSSYYSHYLSSYSHYLSSYSHLSSYYSHYLSSYSHLSSYYSHRYFISLCSFNNVTAICQHTVQLPPEVILMRKVHWARQDCNQRIQLQMYFHVFYIKYTCKYNTDIAEHYTCRLSSKTISSIEEFTFVLWI